MRKLDMIIAMDLFMAQIDGPFVHKSFVKKIQNRLDRHLKRADPLAVRGSKTRLRMATKAIDNTTVNVAPLVWAIQNKYPDVFHKDLGMEREWFEKFNKMVGAQLVTMDSLRLITALETELKKL